MQLKPLICGLWQLHVVAETDIMTWVGTGKIGLAYLALKTLETTKIGHYNNIPGQIIETVGHSVTAIQWVIYQEAF